MNDLNLTKFPRYGDVMLLSEFQDCMKSGMITPYDGEGCYATSEGFDDYWSCFSDPPEWATHVVWFNK